MPQVEEVQFITIKIVKRFKNYMHEQNVKNANKLASGSYNDYQSH
jgi:hypothetical protein